MLWGSGPLGRTPALTWPPVSRLLARSLLTWDSAMSARSSASSSSCCTLRNLDRLVLACSSCRGSGWEGEVREGGEVGIPSLLVLGWVQCSHPSLMSLQQPCQGHPTPAWHPPQTYPALRILHGHPLSKMNPMLPGPAPLNPVSLHPCNCESERCSLTCGFLHRRAQQHLTPTLLCPPRCLPPCTVPSQFPSRLDFTATC